MLCIHKYGKPITYDYVRYTSNGEKIKTITIFYYQCKKCGKVKKGKEMPYIEKRGADRLIENGDRELVIDFLKLLVKDVKTDKEIIKLIRNLTN